MKVWIASDQEREKVFAELHHDGEDWAVVTQEEGSFKLDIYPRVDGNPWVFDLMETIEALERARRRLLGEIE